jgi:cytochrome c5
MLYKSSNLYYFILLVLLIAGCSTNNSRENHTERSYHLAPEDLPDYEANLDHAGLIKAWDKESLRRGLVIYRTTCYPCHGNQDQPGSLPNSIKFWESHFKNGSDPYALYQTITRGYGQMPPQVRLTPTQKYDVIHFIRETFIKENISESYAEITEALLNDLPQGTDQGPEAQPYHPWKDMDYGNWLIQCYEMADDRDPPKQISGGPAPLANEDYHKVNFAYKGIAMRLDTGSGGVARGKAFAMFDHDLMRFVGTWTGEGFIDWESILLDDQHNIYPRIVGEITAANPITPGWADPATGSFIDPRIRGLDDRPFGPLPRSWAHYKGIYDHDGTLVIKYTVGEAEILESYRLEDAAKNIFSRIINSTKSVHALKMRILPDSFKVVLQSDYGTLTKEDGYHILQIPPNIPVKAKITFSNQVFENVDTSVDFKNLDLTKYTRGGSQREPGKISSPIISGNSASAYSEDVITLPLENEFKSRVRPTGIEFINQNKDALVCTIDGEIWKIENITQASGPVQWSRIATGLFQPLGIKLYKDQIFVSCRDQIVRLHDLNNDGTIDYYESFNSDHQVTEHFHEFAMGLQCDVDGNFYYAKSGRHARTSLVPQHGTLIKVSADGENSTILANGFRAANGVCLNPDGSFFVTDQEGFWNPMNRINRVVPGGFYGNMWGYGAPQDSSDQAMQMPLCWVDMKYDRSPAELLWVESDRWGPLNGKLLSLSYGYGKIFVILTQDIGDNFQAGIIELPVPQFPTGLIRGRFNPSDGQLYTCGMSAWATSQMIQTGGLYRVRYNEGKEFNFPVEMKAITAGIKLQFSEAIDEASAKDTTNFQISTWQLKRTRQYGSKRYDTKKMQISSVQVMDQGKTILINIPDIEPTWIMEIVYTLKSEAGKDFSGSIQNTIYSLAEEPVL